MRSLQLEASVDEAEALRYLGYCGQRYSDTLWERFQTAVKMVNTLQPKGVYRVFSIDSFQCDNKGVPCAVRLCGTSFVLPGYHIATHLQGACKAVLMAVTLGMESEMLLRREMARSKTNGMLVDACASSFVESAANNLSYRIEQMAREQNLMSGPRFSPGYGDFPLDAQHEFGQTIGMCNALGVRVTDANLLIPSKSITAICGLYDSCSQSIDAKYEHLENQRMCVGCELCFQKETCVFKQQGRTCNGS